MVKVTLVVVITMKQKPVIYRLTCTREDCTCTLSLSIVCTNCKDLKKEELNEINTEIYKGITSISLIT